MLRHDYFALEIARRAVTNSGVPGYQPCGSAMEGLRDKSLGSSPFHGLISMRLVFVWYLILPPQL